MPSSIKPKVLNYASSYQTVIFNFYLLTKIIFVVVHIAIVYRYISADQQYELRT